MHFPIGYYFKAKYLAAVTLGTQSRRKICLRHKYDTKQKLQKLPGKSAQKNEHGAVFQFCPCIIKQRLDSMVSA